MKYTSLVIGRPEDLRFGRAPFPVTSRRGIVVGGGSVYPELNFTLPTMHIEAATLPEIREHYRSIVTEALERAIELGVEGVVLEFETLLEMTLQPEIGIDLVRIMNGVCEDFYARRGMRSAIRLTPNDTRDYDRPPLMRSGPRLDAMLQLFEEGARAGGEFLSIESTGGKEVHDDALLYTDAKGVVFALGVLGVRDMGFLWKKIMEVARKTGVSAGGDTACGFANTAMVLAEKKYIPRVFAAFDRAVSIVRTLVAHEEGAIGPDKDCGYEGPFLKAITGIPISMEGKTSACAHMSPVGNVAAAACDLWSNESVQNIKLLGGMAPTIYLEQLAYDARLMNESINQKSDATLQKLLVDSDIRLDPQALVLAPSSVIAISKEIVGSKSHLEAALRAGKKALDIIEEAHKAERLSLTEREVEYIDRIRGEIAEIPTDESAFVEMMLPSIDASKVILKEYGL
ncbi:MAG: methyltransferase MtaB domain-containing protein [Rectinemataceae bacterium]|jgi:methanol--5-hydroxybenzimidazolylcobamide Co-methyltransferase